MKRCLLLLSFLVALGGCSIRFVSDYDEVIDKGIAEFSEQLGGHIKNMGELGGRPEGTYDANLKTYNALEAKLDVLIDRANSAAEGKGCKLEDKVFQHISSVMNCGFQSAFNRERAPRPRRPVHATRACWSSCASSSS